MSVSKNIQAASAFGIIAILFTLLSGAALAADSTPVADPAFEATLTRELTYRTRSGDTLTSSARLLYGRRSWWSKLRDRNPQIASKGAHDLLPVGTQIKYLAPVVGDRYTVRQGDWLVRIVQWRYGETSYWEKVFKLNESHLKNPNLIHPGDVLAMTDGGMVQNQTTGDVVMQPVDRGPAAQALDWMRGRGQEVAAWETSRWFLTGFGIGLVVLALSGLAWWFYRPSELKGALAGSSEGGVFSGSPAARKKPRGVFEEKTPEEQAAVAARKKLPTDGMGYPYEFNKRALEPLRTERGIPTEDARWWQPSRIKKLFTKPKRFLK